MSDPVAHELLRELLNETRELRRHLAAQSEHLAALEFLARGAAPDEVRQADAARRAARSERQRQLNRRVDPGQQPLIDWLARRGLEFDGFVEDRHGSGPADEIATILAESYGQLSGFVKALVHAHCAKDGLSYALDGLPEVQAAAIAAFAQRLEDFGFVRAMNVAGDAVHVEPLQGEKVELLLSGGWLERAVYNLAARLKPRRWAPQRIAANARGKNAAGESYEIDLLLPGADGAPPVSIDSKTGSLAQSKATIWRNRKLLKLPKNRNLVVLPVDDAATLEAWSESLPIATVVPFSRLRETLAPL